jgi:hypothetical protein
MEAAEGVVGTSPDLAPSVKIGLVLRQVTGPIWSLRKIEEEHREKAMS